MDNILAENIFIDSRITPSNKFANRDTIHTECHQKVQKLNEEIVCLYDEILRSKEIITTQERQLVSLKRQSRNVITKYQRLEKEYEEQEDKLSKSIEREKTSNTDLQKSTKEYRMLFKKFEAAELKVQDMSYLQTKLDNTTQEILNYKKQIIVMKKEFEKIENERETLRLTVAELKEAYNDLTKVYKTDETVIQKQREKLRLLMSENADLQSRLEMNNSFVRSQSCGCTPYKRNDIQSDNSLYAELVTAMTGEIAKNNETDFNTQIQADLLVTDTLEEFDVADFYDHPKYSPETHKEIQKSFSIDKKDDSFLNTSSLILNVVEDYLDVHLTVEAPNKIIEDSSNVQKSAREDFVSEISRYDRYKPIYTLPSNSCAEIKNSPTENIKHEMQSDYESSLLHKIGDCPMSKITVNKSSDDFVFQENPSDILINVSTQIKQDLSSSPVKITTIAENDSILSPASQEIGCRQKIEDSLSMDIDSDIIANPECDDIQHSSIKVTPKRKFSVFHRPFEIITVPNEKYTQLQALEVKDSMNSPINTVQENIDEAIKESYLIKEPRSDDYLSSDTYRSLPDNSISSDSPTSSLCDTSLDASINQTQKKDLHITLAPAKLKNFNILGPQDLEHKFSIKCEDDIKAISLNRNVTIEEENVKDGVKDKSKYQQDKVSEINSKINVSSIVRDDRKNDVSPSINENEGSPVKVEDLASGSSVGNTMCVNDNSCRKQPVPFEMLRSADSSVGFDSECDSKEMDKKVNTKNILSFSLKHNDNNEEITTIMEKKRQPFPLIRRSLSDSESNRRKCTNCQFTKIIIKQQEDQVSVFPSLTGIPLEKSDIVNSSELDSEYSNSFSESELERKYMALSIGINTDKITVRRRMELSSRQRDQSEKNFACEIKKMQQDIQELAQHCIDGESIERVEKIRHQLDMIAQCSHRISCTAETLGAVRQEYRISKAILLADRYLQMLRSKCEKLAADISETKQILVENNIMVEEHIGELGDDTLRIRYRSGALSNNRMMMSKRRASIATITRPLGIQDIIKDGTRQRSTLGGKVTLRRISFNYETQKYEDDKVEQTDSNGVRELQDMFEQAETKVHSQEENNNASRIYQSDNLNTVFHNNSNKMLTTNFKQEPVLKMTILGEKSQDTNLCTSRSQTFWKMKNVILWHFFFSCMSSFIFGFYIHYIISSSNECSDVPFKWWSLEEILDLLLHTKNIEDSPI